MSRGRRTAPEHNKKGRAGWINVIQIRMTERGLELK